MRSATETRKSLPHGRHNDILQRLIKAIPDSTGNKFVEQEVPGDPERNKPDLVIISLDKQKATIVDVTVPFEGDEESFSKAREAKEPNTPPSSPGC